MERWAKSVNAAKVVQQQQLQALIQQERVEALTKTPPTIPVPSPSETESTLKLQKSVIALSAAVEVHVC